MTEVVDQLGQVFDLLQPVTLAEGEMGDDDGQLLLTVADGDQQRTATTGAGQAMGCALARLDPAQHRIAVFGEQSHTPVGLLMPAGKVSLLCQIAGLIDEARAQAAACNAAQAKAEVNQARLQVVEALLEQTRLTAPFAGIVAEINGEVGEFVTPSPIGVEGW